MPPPTRRRERGRCACGCSRSRPGRGRSSPTRCASGASPTRRRTRCSAGFDDVGLIDDAAFARAWVESRHYSRGLAGRALSAELKQRGVAADEIRAAIDEQLGPDAEVSAARRLVERKLAATRGLPPEQRTRRLAGLLARKGYPAGLAFRVIREALEAEGEAAFPEDEPSFDGGDLRYGMDVYHGYIVGNFGSHNARNLLAQNVINA